MIEWILLIIVVEAVTEIITSSDLTSGLRFWLTKKAETNKIAEFFNKVVSCGYCCSVWVSAAVAWIAPGSLIYPFVDYILKVFGLHRLSNIFHEFVKRWLDRIPFAIVVSHIHADDQSEQSEVLGE